MNRTQSPRALGLIEGGALLLGSVLREVGIEVALELERIVHNKMQAFLTLVNARRSSRSSFGAFFPFFSAVVVNFLLVRLLTA